MINPSGIYRIRIAQIYLKSDERAERARRILASAFLAREEGVAPSDHCAVAAAGNQGTLGSTAIRRSCR